MSEQKKSASVPVLRFPEFQDAGKWTKVRLGQLGELIPGLTYSPSDVRDNGLLVLRSSNVQNGNIFLGNNVYVTPEIKGAKLSKPNDILICVRNGSKALIGKSALIPEGMPLCTHGAFMTVVRAKSAKFIFQLFQSEAYKRQVSADLGATINSINGSQLKKYEFFVPEPKEQKKISECLSSIDKLVTDQTKKLDTLKAHKKGLMQRLFPVGEETVPKLRFPKFRDKGEWVKLKVSNILERVSNPVDVNIDKTYSQIGIRSHGKGIFYKDPVLGKELGNKRVFWVVENAFIVNIVFAWELAVASTTASEKGMIASHRFPMYKPYKNKSVISYIKYFFLTHKGKELLWIASPGGAGRNKTLGQKDFENLELLIPKSIEEQQTISDCLSSIDGLIDAQVRKINALKMHKKSLMQRLLLSTNEAGV